MMDVTSFFKKHIHAIIMVLVAYVISVLPPVGVITPYGMKVLGVFVSLIYGWCFYDLMWASICGFVLLGFFGINTVTGALSSSLGNSQITTMICGMLIAGALTQLDMTKFVSAWLLKRKIIQKSPWMLVSGLIFIAYVVGLLGVTTGGVFILWAVTLSIADSCGVDRKNPILTFLAFMIVIGLYTGNSALPFRVGALMFGGFLTKATGLAVGYIAYTVVYMSTTFVALIVMILVAKYILRMDASQFVATDEIMEQFTKESKATPRQICGLLFLFAFTVVLFLPEFFPTAPGMAFIKTLGLPGVVLVMMMVMHMITFDGKPAISLNRVFQEGIQWMVIIVVSVVFPVVDAMKSADSGILTQVVGMLTPLSDGLGIIPFMLVTMVLVGVISEFTHNIAVGAVVIPLFTAMVLPEHGATMTLIYYFLMYISLNAAYATPASSVGGALAFSSELTTRKSYGYIIGIVYFIVMVVLGTIFTFAFQGLF